MSKIDLLFKSENQIGKRSHMQLNLNGKPVNIPDDQHDELLLWVLHGSCTVILDGKATKSCQTKTSDAIGKKLVTLEGLATSNQLHPVQQAFLENPLQCCYCMTGHIMTAAAFLEKTPNPNAQQIDTAMTVNLCRCGGYNNIRKNVTRASEIARGGA
jgi:aerobic-type carbon monoxide dehydrogenase small subunit (CoxS/CutS family)